MNINIKKLHDKARLIHEGDHGKPTLQQYKINRVHDELSGKIHKGNHGKPALQYYKAAITRIHDNAKGSYMGDTRVYPMLKYRELQNILIMFRLLC